MIKKLPGWIFGGAGLLSFSAGFVNVVGMSTVAGSSVSHLSGVVTLSIEKLVYGDLPGSIKALDIGLAFFAGSVLCGVIVKNEALKAGRRYGVAMLIESILLLVAMFFLSNDSNYGLLWAAAACGLQNAMVATYSGSIIRTTHLTGLITDLGAAVGHSFAGLSIDWRKISINLLILFGFGFGGCVGAFVYKQINCFALIFPAGLVATAGLYYMNFILPKARLEEAARQ